VLQIETIAGEAIWEVKIQDNVIPDSPQLLLSVRIEIGKINKSTNHKTSKLQWDNKSKLS
jgi:hypothetical protein